MRNSIRFLLSILALVVVIAACCGRPGHAQTLQWKFAEGDSFAINIQQTSSVETIVDRRAVEQSSKTTLEIEWIVENLDGDNATIRQTITRIIAELTMPGKTGAKTIRYDSDVEKHKGDARRLSKSFSQIVNQPISMTITPRGQIIDVKIPEETLESIRQMPGSMQGRKMLEPESLREMFMQAGMELPESNSGGSWETIRNFSIGTPQKLSQTLNYSIADPESKPVQIEFTGLLKIAEAQDDRSSDIEFENLEIESQESSGTIWFDTESGNCRSSNSVTRLKTRTRYRDMDVVATINSSVEMTVERK